jgi:hypothetical protein
VARLAEALAGLPEAVRKALLALVEASR